MGSGCRVAGELDDRCAMVQTGMEGGDGRLMAGVAYQALFLEGGMKEGQNVLIHAVSADVMGVYRLTLMQGMFRELRVSGWPRYNLLVSLERCKPEIGQADCWVSHLIVHVGHANKVFATCGTDDKVKFLEKLCGDSQRFHAFNYRTQSERYSFRNCSGSNKESGFEEEVKKVDDGVDIIVDFIGRNYFNYNLNLLRRDGTMVILAFMSGPVLSPDTNIMQLLFKRLTLKGSTLRSRTVDYQGALLRGFEKDALPLIREGKMRVEVHEVNKTDLDAFQLIGGVGLSLGQGG